MTCNRTGLDAVSYLVRNTDMNVKLLSLGLLSLSMALVELPSLAQAQPPAERPGERPGRGPGGLLRINPIFAALDTNSDGILDEKEINGAVAALKKLDKNADGQITEDEVRPAMGRGRGGPEMREGGPGGRNPDDAVTRLMQFDKNADGKLAKDEVPERMQAIFERGDKDKDGFLSKEEVRGVAEAPRPAAPSLPANPVAPPKE